MKIIAGMGNYNNDSSDGDYYHKGDDVDDGIQMAKIYKPRLYLGVSIKWGEFPDAHLETSGTDILQPNINCIIGLCGSSVLRRDKHKGSCSNVLKYSHIFVRVTKKQNF